jgi:hypothetical protein
MDWTPIPTGKRTATGWVIVPPQRWQATAAPPGASSAAGPRIRHMAEVRRVVGGGSPNILDTWEE